MVDIVFGNTVRELLNKINDSNLLKDDIIDIVFNGKIYLCFYQVKNGREKK